MAGRVGDADESAGSGSITVSVILASSLRSGDGLRPLCRRIEVQGARAAVRGWTLQTVKGVVVDHHSHDHRRAARSA